MEIQTFTFQYVSIKTERDEDEIKALMDLHSNMFLLRLLTLCLHLCRRYTFTFQYVSIKTTQPPPTLTLISLFTFQYVSIKTPLYISSWARCKNLHSNMFLLRRQSRVSDGKNRMHLHSNMFLLRLSVPRCQLRCNIHLHSNMFLLRRLFGRVFNRRYNIYIPICFY